MYLCPAVHSGSFLDELKEWGAYDYIPVLWEKFSPYFISSGCILLIIGGVLGIITRKYRKKQHTLIKIIDCMRFVFLLGGAILVTTYLIELLLPNG